MSNIIIGDVYGDYQVIKFDTAKSEQKNRKYWLCQCIQHGTHKVVREDVLKHKSLLCQCTYKDIQLTCSIEGCNDIVFCKNYCSHHYYLYNKYGNPLYIPEKISQHCAICGIADEQTRIIKDNNGIYMCFRHYMQIREHGHILERTQYDRNDIIVDDDCALILIRDNKGKEICQCIIDQDDVDLIKQYSWHLNGSGYAIAWNDNKHIRLHRLITNAPSNMIVDHINHNTLDNRKNNLRICTQTHNLQNKAMQTNNTSGVIGVHYSERLDKWIAQISFHKNRIHLGCYENFEDAVEARKRAEQTYFKEYTYDASNDCRLQEAKR